MISAVPSTKTCLVTFFLYLSHAAKCGNKFEDGCKHAATDRDTVPCGAALRAGQGSCTQIDYDRYYKCEEIADYGLCFQHTDSLPEVD